MFEYAAEYIRGVYIRGIYLRPTNELVIFTQFAFTSTKMMDPMMSQAAACDGIFYQIPGNNALNPPPGVLPI